MEGALIIFGSIEGIVGRYQNSETHFYSNMDMSNNEVNIRNHYSPKTHRHNTGHERYVSEIKADYLQNLDR